MAIIALKAWYLEQYEPIREVLKRPHDLRLSRNSLLKSGLRADFLEDSAEVESSEWFRRYLEGERVEFYIEGSGGYLISNIDLLSHEIYFTKQDIAAWQEPVIFLSYQTEYATGREIIHTALEEALIALNRRSRLAMELALASRPLDATVRLSSSQLRQIRKSLLFIADVTAISAVQAENKSYLLPSPHVCVEIGYALQTKDRGQILLLSQDRPDLAGELTFDLPQHQQLNFTHASELSQTLPNLLETLLQRFNLFA